MCDYSLEMYRSRPAQAGESLTTTRFPSGSIGLADSADPGCAVCMGEGTRLELNLSGHPEFAARHGLREIELATFTRLESGIYRDGVRFDSGVELSLQQIPCGVGVKFVDVVAEVGVDPTQPQQLREPVCTHDGTVVMPAIVPAMVMFPSR